MIRDDHETAVRIFPSFDLITQLILLELPVWLYKLEYCHIFISKKCRQLMKLQVRKDNFESPIATEENAFLG